MSLKRKPSRAGFTLLEIMLVVIIISLLIGVAIVAVAPNLKEAQKVQVKGHVQSFTNALEMYYARAGFYPSSQQGLDSLVNRPAGDPKPRNWAQVLKSLPTDPWGSAYVYKQPGEKNTSTYDVYSLGPDRKDGTGDEIGNWEQKSD